jgi:NAD-dependent SIR2 family protein deacetylase
MSVTSIQVVVDQLLDILSTKSRIWILTGAGISAPSGIPTYRDDNRAWQHSQPIQHDDFINHSATRKRYWARSLVGFHYFSKATPNSGHYAIARIQNAGYVSGLVTQNVDRLHSEAGARDVIDLHGRLDRVVCLDCHNLFSRFDFQKLLENSNLEFNQAARKILPDGDAELEENLISEIIIPGCSRCGGVVMPDVVFFGGKTPEVKVRDCRNSLEASDCVLVCGSSLSVYSGFRFIKKASEMGLPLLAVNKGIMRGQELFDLAVAGACEEILPGVADGLGCR